MYEPQASPKTTSVVDEEKEADTVDWDLMSTALVCEHGIAVKNQTQTPKQNPREACGKKLCPKHMLTR